jgi:hypothetical protein
MRGLNALGQRVLEALLEEHPEWDAHAEAVDDGDLRLVVPAPRGSRAKHLVVLTDHGKHVWIRYAPPRTCHLVTSEQEMNRIIHALLTDAVSFLVISRGDEWIETSLLPPDQEPTLLEGQVADVVSWSGHNDRIVTYTARNADDPAQPSHPAKE